MLRVLSLCWLGFAGATHGEECRGANCPGGEGDSDDASSLLMTQIRGAPPVEDDLSAENSDALLEDGSHRRRPGCTSAAALKLEIAKLESQVTAGKQENAKLASKVDSLTKDHADLVSIVKSLSKELKGKADQKDLDKLHLKTPSCPDCVNDLKTIVEADKKDLSKLADKVQALTTEFKEQEKVVTSINSTVKVNQKAIDTLEGSVNVITKEMKGKVDEKTVNQLIGSISGGGTVGQKHVDDLAKKVNTILQELQSKADKTDCPDCVKSLHKDLLYQESRLNQAITKMGDLKKAMGSTVNQTAIDTLSLALQNATAEGAQNKAELLKVNEAFRQLMGGVAKLSAKISAGGGSGSGSGGGVDLGPLEKRVLILEKKMVHVLATLTTADEDIQALKYLMVSNGITTPPPNTPPP